MDIYEIENLPDSIPTGILVLMFKNELAQFKNNEIEKDSFLLILSQLTDRQVMAYELLRSDIRNDIDRTLSRVWNTDSYDEVDIILSIVVNLGLEICFNKIKESLEQYKDIDKLILDEIQETIDEVGENISNPYYSLENYSE
ncbi:hypothetical protein [Lysinibacillus fusiformis]|uniref:Uncharacterized protein n=1 Tax=Lysinibacillus fusiformis TaxID=28031 RepID=A0A1H9IB16_9BACI|nr:hypothetical protein [Lysinibacillus fusiformis]SCY38460.1 hypothetical protein SAMN02787081_02315 [Lysinibacillus fusiformis]SEN62576.1 hypothetical protein SAMN02787103_02215 [Lysinibacillus fusiformis]SEQ71773.1 hypothetical protein SAMN02787113_02221 [Lysinibacillus fusiformis]